MSNESPRTFIVLSQLKVPFFVVRFAPHMGPIAGNYNNLLIVLRKKWGKKKGQEKLGDMRGCTRTIVHPF